MPWPPRIYDSTDPYLLKDRASAHRRPHLNNTKSKQKQMYTKCTRTPHNVQFTGGRHAPLLPITPTAQPTSHQFYRRVRTSKHPCKKKQPAEFQASMYPLPQLRPPPPLTPGWRSRHRRHGDTLTAVARMVGGWMLGGRRRALRRHLQLKEWVLERIRRGDPILRGELQKLCEQGRSEKERERK